MVPQLCTRLEGFGLAAFWSSASLVEDPRLRAAIHSGVNASSGLLTAGWVVDRDVTPCTPRGTSCRRGVASSMARLKRVARQHADGESPTRSASVTVIVQREEGSVDTVHSELSRENRDITHVWALTKDEFGGHCERGQTRSREYQIMGGELHPLVRGFLKFSERPSSLHWLIWPF
jgi:hypothetical protein